jgi:uncharacterized protein YkwD
MRTAMFFFPVFLALITSCTEALIPGHASPKANTAQTTVNKAVLLDLVNAVRKTGCQCGDSFYTAAPALTWNDRLESAAAGHAKDMFQNRYFSHIEADGSNAGVRLERAGYSWSIYGENIASGQKNEQEVIAGWLLSPGHCKNIMNKNYKEMGVGRAGNVWTQVFALKK